MQSLKSQQSLTVKCLKFRRCEMLFPRRRKSGLISPQRRRGRGETNGPIAPRRKTFVLRPCSGLRRPPQSVARKGAGFRPRRGINPALHAQEPAVNRVNRDTILFSPCRTQRRDAIPCNALVMWGKCHSEPFAYAQDRLREESFVGTQCCASKDPSLRSG